MPEYEIHICYTADGAACGEIEIYMSVKYDANICLDEKITTHSDHLQSRYYYLREYSILVLSNNKSRLDR